MWMTLNWSNTPMRCAACPMIFNMRSNLEPRINSWSNKFADKSALFLGRGIHYPIALEGALKLKEIYPISMKPYPAGELKHGPLALVDENMPVVVIAPNDSPLIKSKPICKKSRRGGELFVFTDLDSDFSDSEGVHVIRTHVILAVIAHCTQFLYTIVVLLMLRLPKAHRR